ncbi:MmgE/PrpD family protein [Mesorhizobium sp. M3A.F.Ca.ET.080.04.2.1]|uniref:MmgE/PrpD family protein n=1 Tax=Mesorhizobium sp. M3A.F.Ca.ET.080.04.2.1 TaxID=2493676 RepID=UPI000F75ADE7|nr:MmgE/PrpD family protein [Mesorhizobium sp. M3A.F.Ca.ET.080.04.2.1]AZO07881.1 MmgE/PrpD family protein [Mesorhizobium sp. M3A.F.Ca.ET.080.04.2.1]
MGATTTREIAEFVRATSLANMPTAVVDYAKLLGLSHVGMNVAGTRMKVGKTVIGYVQSKGGHNEAGVFGAGFRAPVEYATIANANSAHATELEDDSFPETMYSCGHWPAVFALSEKYKLSGDRLLEALILGYEVAAQLGLAFDRGMKKGWASWAALGTIGNAVAASKLMDLDVDQTTAAISLAVSQSAGLLKQTGSGAHIIEAGFAGRNGICSAELASLGYVGQPDILEGTHGFGELWADTPTFDLDLGADYRIYHVGIKKYPCCFFKHRNMDGLLELIREHGLRWDDVESVDHGINVTHSQILKYDQPDSAEQARFSLSHATVACFFEKSVFLSSFSDEKAVDPRWQEARNKVSVTVHKDWPKGGVEAFDSPITVKMKDGRVFEKLVHDSPGEPANSRFGSKEVIAKFQKCLDFAALYSADEIKGIERQMLELDQVRDLTGLVETLTFPRRLNA